VLSSNGMAARDTTRAAAELQDEIHRRFTPAEKFRMAAEMSEYARSLTRAGLRSRHPEMSEKELDDEMLYVLYGFRVPRK
jgi:Rv0078B-related antitoxin